MPELYLAINAKGAVAGSQEFASATKRVTGSTKTATASVKKYGAAIKGLVLGVGMYAAIRAFKAFVKIVDESEKSIAQLEAGLESTNYVSGQTVSGIQAIADEIQSFTAISDDAIEEIAGIGLSFTNITDDVFPRFLMVSADVATRMGQDLKSSAIQLAKALNDPVANLGALSRAGIQFSVAQKKVIKDLWQTGQQAEAQRVVLAELERQYSGSARAARDTLGGAISSLDNSFGDLVKTIGKVLSPALTDFINQLTEIVQGVDSTFKAISSERGMKAMANISAAFATNMQKGLKYALIAGAREAQSEIESAVLSGLKSGFKPKEETTTDETGDKPQAAAVDNLADAMDAGLKVLTDYNKALHQQNVLLGMSTKDQRRYKAVLEQGKNIDEFIAESAKKFNLTLGEQVKLYWALQQAKQDQLKNTTAEIEQLERHDEAMTKYREDMLKFREVEQVFNSVKSSAASALTDIALDSRDASSAIKDLLNDITRMLVQRALMSAMSGIGPTAPVAPGVALAAGGVVTAPTRALIGESGPEAVVPLQRGEDGKLGLSGGTGARNETTLVFNGDARGMMEQMMDPRVIQRMNQVYKMGYAI